MKHVTSVTVEADIIRMAQLNNINISAFLENALRAHLAQFDNPELKAINQEILELDTKCQALKCRQASLASENLRMRNWKKIFLDRQAGLQTTWLTQWKDYQRFNKDPSELVDDIIKKTGIPKDYVLKILDDVK